MTIQDVPNVPVKKKRRRTSRKRRDAGSRRLKTRDRDIMRFGAEQTFVRLDTAGEFLAPGYTPAVAEPPPEQLADSRPSVKRPWPADLRHRLMATSRLMRKLESRGYVETIQPWADQPAWYRATAAGLREIGRDWEEIPFPDNYEDLEARLRHDQYFTSHNHVINEVRLLLARGGANMPKKHEWRGERQIERALPEREHGKRRPHKADGIISLQEDGSWPIWNKDRSRVVDEVPMKAKQIIAIEAECTQKNDARLAEILPDLLAFHDFVWYFCLTPTIQKAVADARKQLSSDEDRRRVRVVLLEEYLQL
jgi:DNA-binding PadR family transcriptional regulator